MSIYEKIKKLCENEKTNISSLEKKLSLGNGTIRRWDKTLPSGDRIIKVANYFNISLDSLLSDYIIINKESKENKNLLFKANNYDNFFKYLEDIYETIEKIGENTYILSSNKTEIIMSTKILNKVDEIIKDIIPSLIKHTVNENIDEKGE